MITIPGEYKSVAEFYLAESQRIVNRFAYPVVLKTDLWNEEQDQPGPGGIIGNLHSVSEICAIEYNEQRFFKAQEKFVGGLRETKIEFRQGDIRNLPYDDGKFDVLLDLSTFDHILPKEMPEGIKGYARVIKQGGYLLLIVWCEKYFKDEEIVNYSPNTQYYHSAPLLRVELEKYFDIDEETVLIAKEDRNSLTTLTKFLCRKRPTEA